MHRSDLVLWRATIESLQPRFEGDSKKQSGLDRIRQDLLIAISSQFDVEFVKMYLNSRYGKVDGFKIRSVVKEETSVTIIDIAHFGTSVITDREKWEP